MNILGTVLSYIYSNFNPFNYIPQNFNPVDTKFIKGNDVAYGLSFQDNDDGTSEVKLIISSLSKKNKSVTHNTGIRIASALKGQLSLSLVEDSTGIDRVGITFPEEGINEKEEKYIKDFLFNTYKIEHSVNTSSVEHLGTTKLQMHINNDNSANIGNIYSDPQTVTLDNGDVVVIAKNLKDKTLVSWYLKSDKKGKFRALAGSDGITERTLLKLTNAGNQFVLNGTTILYSQISKEIIGNQNVEITKVFTFDMAKVFQDLKNGKGTKEYLLGNKNGQINREPSFSSEHEISFLQYVERGEIDTIAFLEKDKSSNKQRLFLTILMDGKLLIRYDSIYNFEDSIEQLYVKDNGQGDAVVTAISGENIITFIKKSFKVPSKATVIPADSITSLSDFVHIVNGELMPDITSTVTPITVTETVVTSEPTSPTFIAASSSQPSSIPTKANEGEASSTVEPTTPSPINEETSTVRPTTPSPINEETSTVGPTTEKPIEATETDEGHSSPTESTPLPTTPGSTTQTVLIVRSTTKGISSESPAPTSTRPLLPQISSSTQSPQFLVAGPGGSNNAGIAVGAFFGVGIIIAIGVGVYNFVQRHRRKNAEPSDAEASRAQIDNVSCGGDSIYELDYAEQKGPGLLSRVRSCFGRNKSSNVEQLGSLVRNTRRSSHSSDSNQSANNIIYEPPKTILQHGVSVDGSRSSSESLESSRSPSPEGSRSPSLSCSSTTSKFETILHGVSVDGSRSSSESLESSRSPSPSRS